MSNYNTGNPVPSDDPRDLDDNATNLDNFINGIAANYLDRLGVYRKSYAGLEAAFNALLTNNNLAALAGLTGAADRMAYFTGAGAMALATLTPQARQLLDDTSFGAMLATLGAAPLLSPTLTGTPSAPTAAVGTNTTQLATMAALRAMVLGTVSQTGGAATGAIIETGGTLTGTGAYTKWANGDMEIRKRAVFAGGTAASGSIFRSLIVDQGAFPVAFAGSDLPSIFVNGLALSAGGGWGSLEILPTLSNWGSWSVYTSTIRTGNIQVDLLAKGRWF